MIHECQLVPLFTRKIFTNAWLLITLLYIRNSVNFHVEIFHELSSICEIFYSNISRYTVTARLRQGLFICNSHNRDSRNYLKELFMSLCILLLF